jgi:hypothetical protein
MQIPSVIFERLVAGQFTTDHVVSIFKALETACQEGVGGVGGEIILHFQGRDDVIVKGDLIPTITFTLESVTKDLE